MALPAPVPGLVIRYSYLWHREHLEGREEGTKDRPCAVVAAIRTDTVGDTRVLVLPITHAAPEHPRLAVELPAAVQRRLGLDDVRSWVIISEWNDFVWPGPDLRRVPGAPDGSVAYGMLPPGLFNRIKNAFLALATTGAARKTTRT